MENIETENFHREWTIEEIDIFLNRIFKRL